MSVHNKYIYTKYVTYYIVIAESKQKICLIEGWDS